MVEKVRGALGPISVLEWTAYTNVAGDLLTATPEEIRSLFDVSVVGLLAAVQALLPDLKSAKGAVLVTNGYAGIVDPKVDGMLTQYGIMGLGITNAAKHKLVGLLAKKLEPDGTYVTEVMIGAPSRGRRSIGATAPTIEGSTVAAKYWELYTARRELRTMIK